MLSATFCSIESVVKNTTRDLTDLYQISTWNYFVDNKGEFICGIETADRSDNVVERVHHVHDDHSSPPSTNEQTRHHGRETVCFRETVGQ